MSVLKNRYILKERIGEGGFAKVYRAQDTHVNKVVAIKILNPEFTQHAHDIERFKNEAAIAARIDDEYLVRVTDYGQDGSQFFFVMEHLVGVSLREEIRKLSGRPMSWVRAFKFGEQICSALDVAHSHNVIHRDVKPENIFITRKRNSEGVKLLDLGIAKILHDQYWSGLQKNLSSTNQIIGSPCYISPEQIHGDPNCDVRADIYALGVVLYELVAGVVPFRGSTPVQTLFQHVHVEPVPPSARIEGLRVPAPLESIILTALKKDPKDRFRSAEEMRRSIRFELDHLRSERPQARHVQIIQAFEDKVVRDDAVDLKESKESRSEQSSDHIKEFGTAITAPSVVIPSQPVIQKPNLEAADSAVPIKKIPPAESPAYPGVSVPRKVVQIPKQEAVDTAKKNPRVPPQVSLASASATAPEPGQPPSSKPGQPSSSKPTSQLEQRVDLMGQASPVVVADRVAPVAPLAASTKVMLGFFMMISLMITCSVSTVLAMAIDTSWLDRRIGTSPKTEILEDESAGPGATPLVKTESTQKAPGADIVESPEGPGPQSPPVEILEDPGKALLPQERTPLDKKRAKPSEPSTRTVDRKTDTPETPPSDVPDGLMKIEKTMKSIARRAAAQVQSQCKLSYLTAIERADYKVEFVVDQQGRTERVEPAGPLLKLEKQKCVEDLLLTLVPSFQGAADLQPRFVFQYLVTK